VYGDNNSYCIMIYAVIVLRWNKLKALGGSALQRSPIHPTILLYLHGEGP